MSDERCDLVIRTNVALIFGYRHWITGQDPNTLDAFPCQELIRVEDRLAPRDWISRWTAAGGQIFDGRMIARIGDPIWIAISRFGKPWPPFDFGSGMGIESVGRDEAEALGVIAVNDQIRILKQSESFSPPFIPIEDERITEYLWTQPEICVHCGETKPAKSLTGCDNCGEPICADCRTKGCDAPEESEEPYQPWEPRDAIQSCGAAHALRMGLDFPFGKETAEAIISWCDQAFEFGFPAGFREVEAEAHKMRGEAFESLGFKDRALREYELSVEKDPQVGVKKRIAKLRKECA